MIVYEFAKRTMLVYCTIMVPIVISRYLIVASYANPSNQVLFAPIKVRECRNHPKTATFFT